MTHPWIAALVPALVAAGLCVTTALAEAPAVPAATDSRVAPDIRIAGQPSAAELAAADAAGVRTVINLRRPDEPAGYDEAAEARRLGLEYKTLPFGPAELNDAIFDEARALLRSAQKPVLFHCASGNRAAAVWLPWRVLDDGASYEHALAEAKQSGLRSPEFEQKARDYIERHRRAP